LDAFVSPDPIDIDLFEKSAVINTVAAEPMRSVLLEDVGAESPWPMNRLHEPVTPAPADVPM
jgi:hypothetical protein